MFKLLRVFAVFSLCFLLVSEIAQADEKRHWYDADNATGGFTAVLQGTAGNDNATTEDNADFAHTFCRIG